MDRDEMVYKLAGVGNASLADFRVTIAEAWSDMRHPGTIAHELATVAGIDVSHYPRSVDEAVEVITAETGAEGGHVAVAGLLRSMAREDWNHLWTHVLSPRVKKRFGDHSLVPAESCE
jgi:hypothetical protein